MNVIIYEGVPANCIHNPNSLKQLASVSGSHYTRSGDYINGASCQITLEGHNGAVEIGRIIHPDNTNKYYDITDIKWDTTGNTVVLGTLNYLVTFYSKIAHKRVYLTGSTNSGYNNANIIPPGFVSGNRAVRENLGNVISTVGGFTNVAPPMAYDKTLGPCAYVTVSMSTQTREALKSKGEHAANNGFCTYVFQADSTEFKDAMAAINSNLLTLLSSGEVIDVSYGVSMHAISHTKHKYEFRLGTVQLVGGLANAYITTSRIDRAVDKFVINLSTHPTPNYGACQRSIRFPDGFVLTLPKSVHNRTLYLGYSIDTYKQIVTWVLHDGKGSLTTEHEPDTFVVRHPISYATQIPHANSENDSMQSVITTAASIGSAMGNPIAGALIGAGPQLASAIGSADTSLGNNIYQSDDGHGNFVGDYAVEWVNDISWLNPSDWINKLFSVYDEYCPTYQTTPIAYGSSSSTSVIGCTNGLYTGRIFDGLEAPLLNIVNGVMQNGFYVVN